MSIERYYSINSLARIFDNSEDFWRKKVALGEIKAVKVGRSVRIPEKEVLKLVHSLWTMNDFIEEILNK